MKTRVSLKCFVSYCRRWYFVGCYLYLWKLMLSHLKSIWQIILKVHYTKSEISIEDLFFKWEQIHNILRFWSHLLKKFLIENLIFYAVVLRNFVNKHSLIVTNFWVAKETLQQFKVTITEKRKKTGSWNFILNSCVRRFGNTENFRIWVLLL